MNNDWLKYNEGNSLGSKGSEFGIIIYDEENKNGARITLEKNGDIAPYSVTSGIYGLMFHTHFCSSEQSDINYIEKIKDKISQILTMNIDDNEIYIKIDELTNIE